MKLFDQITSQALADGLKCHVFQKDMFQRSIAVFSPDGLYRYLLLRVWDETKPIMSWVCLNPSTATEAKNDNTVTRCMGYADDWGYGGMFMQNIFALRSTDPYALYTNPDPVGAYTDQYLKMAEKAAKLIVCGWGNHGRINCRGMEVLKTLENPYYLELTKWNMPNHPLYLKKTRKPTPYGIAGLTPGEKNNAKIFSPD